MTCSDFAVEIGSMIDAETRGTGMAAAGEDVRRGLGPAALSPLLSAICRGDCDSIRSILADQPHLIRTRAPANGALPIHYAFLAHGPATLDLLQILVDAWPQSLQERNRQGFLPLHVACDRGASVEVVQFLALSWQRALLERSNNGSLPITLAVKRQLKSLGRRTSSVQVVSFLSGLLPRSGEDYEVELLGILQQKIVHLRAENVSCLIEIWPDLVRKRAPNGSLLLHALAERSDARSVVVAELLVEAWPEALLQTDLTGATPLYTAATSTMESAFEFETESRLRMVRLFTDRRPEAALISNAEGSFPLHSILACRYVVRMVRALVNACPGCVTLRDATGSLPLHIAVARRYQLFEVLQMLIEAWGESVQAVDLNGSLPIHLTFAHSNPSLNVIRLLVEPWPDSLITPNGDGSVPLHMAVAQRYQLPGLVRYMVEKKPESVWVPDSVARLAVHVAAAVQPPSTAVVQALVDHGGPRLLMERDQDGSLPLHHALAAHPPNAPRSDVLRLLVDLCPESLLVRNGNGSPALHMAVEASSIKLVRWMVKTNPSTLATTDRNGFLPVHCAAAMNAPLDMIYFLVSQWPGFLVGDAAPIPAAANR